MNIICTGGNGFIGSNFIDYMLEGERTDVIINIDKMTNISSDRISKRWMDSEHYDEYPFDINDIHSKLNLIVNEGSIDFLVHCAAESHVDNSLGNIDPFIHTNINGTLAVARFCYEKKIKMIHISTDEVYGHVSRPDAKPFDIDDSLKPRNPYAASKASAELMLRAFANTVDGFEYMIVRPSNNYGPHQDGTKFIPKMISCIAKGIPLPLYGFGDFYREWTHVTDTVALLGDIIQYSFHSGNIINISSKMMRSNIEMFEMVLTAYRKYHPASKATIEFINDPRGKAHDKVYSIVNTYEHNFCELEEGIDLLVAGKITNYE